MRTRLIISGFQRIHLTFIRIVKVRIATVRLYFAWSITICSCIQSNEQHIPNKSEHLMCSTSDVYVEFWGYTDKSKSPITRCLSEPISDPCTPYSVNAAYDSLDKTKRMEDGRIPYDLLYYWTGHRVQRQRWSQTSIQRRLQAGYEGPKLDSTSWEPLTDNRAAWKQELSSIHQKRELALQADTEGKRWRRAESLSSNAPPTNDSVLPAKAATASVMHRNVQPHR